jgi:pSer/pThr/pTyr-binding forkhead associated (FHA) protein
MAFYLEIVTGIQSGAKISVYEGLTIGRKQGDLLLEDDPKVSGIHAKIVLDNKNQFILVDQDSANGMVISGRKVKKIAMLPGVTFRIGSTHFRVVQEDTEIPTPPAASKIPDPPSPPPTESLSVASSLEQEPEIPAPVVVAKENPFAKGKSGTDAKVLSVKNWKERVQDSVAAQEPASDPEPKILGAFSPALILDFIEGVQTDQKITLGYGPRQGGFNHLDVELLDPKTPDLAFDLLPGPGSVEIRDLTGGEMLVNGRPVETRFLEEGDLISIGNTKIKVRYL